MNAEPPFDLQERLKLWHLAPIQSYLPIQCGKTKWQHVQAVCFKCKRGISDKHFRGEIAEQFRDIYLVKGVAYCAECELVTCYHWTIKENGVSGYDQRGNWGTWNASRQHWWNDAIDFLARSFK